MLKVFYNFLIVFLFTLFIFVFYRKIINKEHATKFKEKIFQKK